MGNVAVGGGGDDAGGAGAEVTGFDPVAQAFHGSTAVERDVVDGAHQQAVPFFERLPCHLFVTRTEHHAVDAVFGGAACLAKAGGHVSQVQQLNDHMFQNVTRPGALLQTLQETAFFTHPTVVFAQSGQGGEQAVGQAGN